jgi:hypothetical protein
VTHSDFRTLSLHYRYHSTPSELQQVHLLRELGDISPGEESGIAGKLFVMLKGDRPEDLQRAVTELLCKTAH